MNLDKDVDLEALVSAKDDLSGESSSRPTRDSLSCRISHLSAGADIKSLATEAGLLALRERRMRVTKKVSPARWLLACTRGFGTAVLSFTMLTFGVRRTLTRHESVFSTGRRRTHQRVSLTSITVVLCLVADDLPAPRPVPLSARLPWPARPFIRRYSVPLHLSIPLSCRCTSWPTVSSCHPSAQRALASALPSDPRITRLSGRSACVRGLISCRAERVHGGAQDCNLSCSLTWRLAATASDRRAAGVISGRVHRPHDGGGQGQARN
jgi:SpoVK/Ycf46/Vps4 family AAA+-type ATPase